MTKFKLLLDEFNAQEKMAYYYVIINSKVKNPYEVVKHFKYTNGTKITMAFRSLRNKGVFMQDDEGYYRLNPDNVNPLLFLPAARQYFSDNEDLILGTHKTLKKIEAPDISLSDEATADFLEQGGEDYLLLGIEEIKNIGKKIKQDRASKLKAAIKERQKNKLKTEDYFIDKETAEINKILEREHNE